MENPITNIKIAIRKLAEEGVPVKKLIDATKEAEGIFKSYDEGTRKEIYGFLNRVLKDKNVLLLVADRIGDNIPSMIPSWIAYLEKQKDPLTPEEKMNHPLYLEGFDVGKKVGEVVKEQKPAENPKWYDSMDEFYADALIEMVEKSDLIDRDKKNRLVWIEKHRAKPTEWSEEDEDTIEKAICVLEANFEPNEEFSGLDIKRSQLVERLGSLRPQPKQEWSEDERIRNGLIHHLKELREWKAGSMSPIKVKEHYDAWIAYLERQKDRKPDYCHHEVDLSGCSDEYRKAYYDGWNNCNQQHAQLQAEQKPAEWSSVDELKLQTIEAVITQQKGSAAFGGFLQEELINFLKYIRQQPHWKPSEGQMIELRAAISGCSFDTKTLSSLEKDLKKLM